MPTGPSLVDRTRAVSDPVRNFKFQVSMFHTNPLINSAIAEMGFMSVEGIAMNTDMVQYREGGWNTNPHKLPGQTDFAPLTLSAGVFYKKPAMWILAKQMFSVQWGAGSLGFGEEFRFDMAVRVLDHPVTAGDASGSRRNTAGSVVAFQFYNCWAASVSFNNLSAQDNAILIHQMTVHHEGFETFFDDDAVSLVDTKTSQFFGGNSAVSATAIR